MTTTAYTQTKHFLTEEEQKEQDAYFQSLRDGFTAEHRQRLDQISYAGIPDYAPELQEFELKTVGISGHQATFETYDQLDRIADRQKTSPVADIREWLLSDWQPSTVAVPSLELFQEVLWDVTEEWDMTDEEVRDLGIWTAHKFYGYSLMKLGKQWEMTKGQVEGVIKRIDRLMKNDKKTDEANALLEKVVLVCHFCHLTVIELADE